MVCEHTAQVRSESQDARWSQTSIPKVNAGSKLLSFRMSFTFDSGSPPELAFMAQIPSVFEDTISESSTMIVQDPVAFSSNNIGLFVSMVDSFIKRVPALLFSVLIPLEVSMELHFQWRAMG